MVKTSGDWVAHTTAQGLSVVQRGARAPKSAGMKLWPTASSGATSSMLNLARLRTERRIMPSATRMNARGMGSRCSSVSSTMRSRRRAKGLSST